MAVSVNTSLLSRNEPSHNKICPWVTCVQVIPKLHPKAADTSHYLYFMLNLECVGYERKGDANQITRVRRLVCVMVVRLLQCMFFYS